MGERVIVHKIICASTKMTPSYVVCCTTPHLDDPYNITNRQIIERSTILQDNLLERGESIMADRGMMVRILSATCKKPNPFKLWDSSLELKHIVIEPVLLSSHIIFLV